MNRKAHHSSDTSSIVRSTAIVLGVHMVDGQYYRRRDFVSQIENLNRQLNLPHLWIGTSLKDAPKYADETHERIGIIVTAPSTGGRLRGWLKRIHGVGTNAVLFSEQHGTNDWNLVVVQEGSFCDTSHIGVFELTKLPTLVSLLLLHAPELSSEADLNQYVKLINDPMLCEPYIPPSRGFFSGLHRYAMRRLAEKAAKEGQR